MVGSHLLRWILRVCVQWYVCLSLSLIFTLGNLGPASFSRAAAAFFGFSSGIPLVSLRLRLLFLDDFNECA